MRAIYLPGMTGWKWVDTVLILYILLGILGVVGLVLLFLTACWLPVDPNRYYENDSRFYRVLINVIAAVACWGGGLRLHVTGTEKLPKGKRLLFVGNHVSNYDPIVTLYALHKWNIAFISKPSNFKLPWLGRFVRRCCFMDIDRENPRNAIHTINRAAELLKRQEVSVGVYPEGTRSKTGQLLPFHNGVFKVAQKAEADMAVVSVIGTEKVARNYPFRRTDVYLDVLEVLPSAELHKTKTEVIGARVAELLLQNKEKREG